MMNDGRFSLPEPESYSEQFMGKLTSRVVGQQIHEQQACP